jgi:predicted RNase H-like HicB family nuclease
MSKRSSIAAGGVNHEKNPVITLNVRLKADLRPDGDQWVAWCRPLDIVTQADSKDAALGSLEEAVQLWFESCLERGVLEDALAEVGFRKLGSGDAIPDQASSVEVQPSGTEDPDVRATLDYIEVSVPAYIAARQLPDLCATR